MSDWSAHARGRARVRLGERCVVRAGVRCVPCAFGAGAGAGAGAGVECLCACQCAVRVRTSGRARELATVGDEPRAALATVGDGRRAGLAGWQWRRRTDVSYARCPSCALRGLPLSLSLSPPREEACSARLVSGVRPFGGVGWTDVAWAQEVDRRTTQGGDEREGVRGGTVRTTVARLAHGECRERRGPAQPC